MFFRDFCNTKEREVDERRPAFLLKDTQHHTSEPLSYPGLDDQKLNAEFHTMSPEMQRYVRYMLGQVEKRTAASGESGKPTENLAPPTRGSTSGLAEQRPIGIHSKPSSRESCQVENSILNTPITSSRQIDSRLSDHEVRETQSLSDAKPSTANRFTSVNYIKGVAPQAGMPVSLCSNTFSNRGSSRSKSVTGKRSWKPYSQGS